MKDIFDYIKENDIDGVKGELRKDKNNLHRQNSDGDSPLHYACSEGNDKIVELLINKGADVNNDRGMMRGLTPLHYTIVLGTPEIARMLIIGGVDVNRRDNFGSTPLHKAVDIGETEMVRVLVGGGADVNSRNNYGDTPLLRAVSLGETKMVGILLDNNADVNIKNKDGKTALDLAKNDEIRNLLRNAVMNTKTIFDYIKDDNIDGVRREIQKDRNNRNIKDKDGDTPLHDACFRGNEVIVKLLIKENASINAEGCGKRTPLHWACEKGYKNIAELLINNRANLDARDKENRTPLEVSKTSEIKQLINKKLNYSTSYSRPSTTLTFDDYMESGRNNFNKGNYQGAIKDFSQAIKLEPKSSYAYNYRGFAYEKNEDYTEAISDYITTLKFDSTRKHARESLSSLCEKIGDANLKAGNIVTAVQFYHDSYHVSKETNESAKNKVEKMECFYNNFYDTLYCKILSMKLFQHGGVKINDRSGLSMVSSFFSNLGDGLQLIAENIPVEPMVNSLSVGVGAISSAFGYYLGNKAEDRMVRAGNSIENTEEISPAVKKIAFKFLQLKSNFILNDGYTTLKISKFGKKIGEQLYNEMKKGKFGSSNIDDEKKALKIAQKYGSPTNLFDVARNGNETHFKKGNSNIINAYIREASVIDRDRPTTPMRIKHGI